MERMPTDSRFSLEVISTRQFSLPGIRAPGNLLHQVHARVVIQVAVKHMDSKYQFFSWANIQIAQSKGTGRLVCPVLDILHCGSAAPFTSRFKAGQW